MRRNRPLEDQKFRLSQCETRFAEEITRWVTEGVFVKQVFNKAMDQPTTQDFPRAYKGFGYDVSEGKLVTDDPQMSLRWGEFVKRLSETYDESLNV
jgi:hypothetical protein